MTFRPLPQPKLVSNINRQPGDDSENDGDGSSAAIAGTLPTLSSKFLMKCHKKLNINYSTGS